MSESTFQRLEDSQQRLAEVDADAAVLFPSRNLFYLTGFAEEPGERHLLLFVPRDGKLVLLAPLLYEEQLRDEIEIDVEFRTYSDTEGAQLPLREIARDLDLRDGHLLVDDTMHARFTQDLHDLLPEATFGLASEVLADLRVRKDERERDTMRRAADLTDEVCEEVRALGSDAVGLTETELAAEIESRLVEKGADELAFEVIVGSGPNGAKPHHSHGDRVIQPGDPVVLDFGMRLDGYVSDQTRTIVCDGEPSPEFRSVHEIVREAQYAAVDAVEPGATASDVDAAAREAIDAAGYGEEFVHRTGHGVGLDVHEEPYIVGGNQRELEDGMVFSVEPGIYLPGEFGVRIEDLVLVTDDGCERLNQTDRGWKV